MTTEVIRVRGEADGLNTLAVYYRVAIQTFRARLRPVGGGDGLELTEVARVDPDDLETVIEWFDVEICPNLVREALDRPVQVPDTEVVHA